MTKVHDEDRFLILKENTVMTGTTDETLGKIPFIIYRSGKADALYVSTRFVLTESGYLCHYVNTRRLCDDSSALRRMSVEDIEQKAALLAKERMNK